MIKTARRSGKKGFTLVELVITIAILAILAAIAVPTVSHLIEQANQSSDATSASNLQMALKTSSAEVVARTIDKTDAHTQSAAGGAWTDDTKKVGYRVPAGVLLDKNFGLQNNFWTIKQSGTNMNYVYDSTTETVVVKALAASTGTDYVITSASIIVFDKDGKITVSTT